MKLFFFLAWVLGFVYLVIRIEGYFIYKSIQAWKDLKAARDRMNDSKKELEEYLTKCKSK